MNQPKLKYPRICRILTYVVVVGCGLLPIFAVFHLPVHDMVKAVVIVSSLIGLSVYLIKNFAVLMMMDMVLASLSCYRTARRQYDLPSGRTADTIRCSILRFGRQCDPGLIQPQPSALRYKFSNPWTVYSCGIERIVAAYEVDYLDNDIYRGILSSAKTNSKALSGKKKAIFLDETQKKAPLHRVTVVLILAHKIDPKMIPDLYDLVCKQCGDENENCIVPCIVDLAQHTCVFNCLRVPYIGFGYAVKNRGIRLIKNRVFGGNLNLRGNERFLEPIRDLNPEDSLWDFWRDLQHQFIGTERATKRRFEAMGERGIQIEGDMLYLKWDHRGVCQSVELDAENKIARIESVTNWAYPKAQPIGKTIIQKIEDHISTYYTRQGYTAKFVDIEILA